MKKNIDVFMVYLALTSDFAMGADEACQAVSISPPMHAMAISENRYQHYFLSRLNEIDRQISRPHQVLSQDCVLARLSELGSIIQVIDENLGSELLEIIRRIEIMQAYRAEESSCASFWSACSRVQEAEAMRINQIIEEIRVRDDPTWERNKIVRLMRAVLAHLR